MAPFINNDTYNFSLTGELNCRRHIFHQTGTTDEPSTEQDTGTDNNSDNIERIILQSPGPIISSTELGKKYQLRKIAAGRKMTIKQIIELAFTNLEGLDLGQIETYTIKANKTQVSSLLHYNF